MLANLTQQLLKHVDFLEEGRKEHLKEAELCDYPYQRGFERGIAIGYEINISKLKNLIKEVDGR